MYTSLSGFSHWKLRSPTEKCASMIYCISILENFSRAILASAISRTQDAGAFFAVCYAAARHSGNNLIHSKASCFYN